MHVMELSDISGHVVVAVSTVARRHSVLRLITTHRSSLNAAISCHITVTSIGSCRSLIQLTAQLLSAQSEKTAAGIGIGYR